LIHALLLASVGMDVLMIFFLAANLAGIRRLSRSTCARDRMKVSVVIPARDEERSIEAAVRGHLAQSYSDIEVIVVDDQSTDGTGEILSRLAREDPRLVVVAGVPPPSGWLGKPHALWEGAQKATGLLLLFADADVVYGREALARTVAFLEETKSDLLCLIPSMETRGFWEGALMPYLLNALFLGPGFLANSDRFRKIAAGGGAGNLIRRAAYDQVGGHAAIRESVIDDIHLALRVKGAGLRARVVRAERDVSVRMYRGFREVCNGFTKNVAYAFSGPFGLWFGIQSVVGILLTVLPVVVLIAAALGISVSSSDAGWAAAGYGLFVLAQAALAVALGRSLWPCLTHPIMAAVWAGIICRSFYHRIVRRRLIWRGRQFDAREARF
jgi:glycosyltransferase involved in cell wall biosynthesis